MGEIHSELNEMKMGKEGLAFFYISIIVNQSNEKDENHTCVSPFLNSFHTLPACL